jgi:membrane protease YdiL (CAAX protease family)
MDPTADGQPPVNRTPESTSSPGSDLVPPGAEPGLCAACGRPLKSGAAFCGFCGHHVGAPPPDRKRLESLSSIRRRIALEWGEVSWVIILFVVLLIIQVVTALAVQAGVQEFSALVTADVLLGGAVVAAAVRHRSDVLPLLTNPGFRLPVYVAIAFASIPLCLLIGLFVRALQSAFHVEAIRYLGAFQGRGFWWPILIICVNAAVFEELAFRGVIYGVLRKHVGLNETLIISSAAFGIVHLSVFAFISHTLLGLYLGWLRHHSGSLYPPMLAHFLHNALVLAGEAWL